MVVVVVVNVQISSLNRPLSVLPSVLAVVFETHQVCLAICFSAP